MAGLNYGNKFKRRTPWMGKDGVFYATYIYKWIVRINNTTLAQFNSELEAIKFYETKLSADTSMSIA